MKVALIKIKNILGIAELEFQPGRVTEITGANAVGKTSILEAIRSVTRSGHDATLLRKGESSGEVVLVLDDGMEVGRRYTETKSYPYAKKEGMQASSPVGFITGLTSAFAANPVDFLVAGEKQRMEILLSSIPVEADHDKLEELAGAPLDPNLHPLQLIDNVRQRFYNERTAVNRNWKEKEATIKRLRESLPEDTPQADELRARRDALDGELAELHTKEAKAIEKIRDSVATKIATATKESEALEGEIQEKIEQLRAQLAELRERRQEKTATIQQAGAHEISAIKIKGAERAQGIRGELAKIDLELEQAVRNANTVEFIESERVTAEGLEKRSDALTCKLEELDEYRASLLRKLPIKGLAIDNGQLTLDGIDFDRVNHAEQVRVAIELAKLHAGDLGLVCVDGLELLDKKHYDEFLKQAKKGDVQLIVTRVSEGELQIRAENDEANSRSKQPA